MVAKTVALSQKAGHLRWSPPTTCASSPPATSNRTKRASAFPTARNSPIRAGSAVTPRRSTCGRPRKWRKLFADIPEALQNSVEIARRCSLPLKLGESRLPNYPLPEGTTVDAHIRAESERGFAEREKVFDAIAARAHHRVSRSPAARARRHLPDGFPGLLPHRRGLHPLGARQRRAGGAGPRLGRRIAGGLQPRHHRHRSAQVRPAVRAFPESRTRVDARLRHRLLHGRPRPRHRIRLAEVRPRARLADHHLRHHGGEGRGARRGPRARHGLRLRRQDRQAHSVRARHHAR